MSSIFDFLNKGVNPNANSTGVRANLPAGKQRSYFLEPEVKASSLATTLSGNEKLKGRSKSTDQNGKPYPWGFTPEVDFYQDPKNTDSNTNSPVERGNILNAGIIDSNGNGKYGIGRDVNDILDQDVPNAFTAFRDGSGYEYLHRLDRGEIPVGVQLSRDSDIYLSSYTETDTDNEDPVSFGYDIIINHDTSPLFNGAVEDFITEFSNYSEISSRYVAIEQFKKQFFKFFNVDIKNTLGYDQPRTYYLQKISGLNDLSESITSDKFKQFVDYGKDYITLTLREDVSVNTGYLAALYKLLTWSRVHGKKMIPDNLLRFDIEIVVTEARKFNRVIKNNDNTMDQYADLLSRYRYKLYECQFFFENFSHGNEIDMSNLDYSNGYDIKFNYKFTTMRFEKFTDENTIIGSSIIRKHIELDNSNVDLSKIDPKNSNRLTISNNTIILNPIDYVMNKYTPIGESTTYNPILLPTNAVQTIDPFSSLNKSSVNNFQQKLNNMDIPTLVTTVTNKTTLLQRTLENIESTFKSNVNRFIYNLKQDILDFVPGNYVGGFTEDGYEYNIPAYYINKAFNTANNTLRKSIGTVGRRIYQEKNIYVQGLLGNIDEVIDKGNNLLNKELGKITGYYDGGGTKPSNIYDTENVNYQTGNNTKHIYGDGGAVKIVYEGSNTSSDDAPIDPPHHLGIPFDIYGNEGRDSHDPTPAHTTGTTFDIYGNEGRDSHDPTPTHHKGTIFDIYGNEGRDSHDPTPSHTTGTTFDIYGNEGRDSHDPTPTHHSGTTFDIYGNEGRDSHDPTPAHTTGTPFDIYGNEGRDSHDPTPAHNTGAPFDIYGNEGRDSHDPTPEHNTGTPFDIYENLEIIEKIENKQRSIYDYEKSYEDTPPHTIGDMLDIYKYEPNYENTPAHKEGKPMDIYDKKENIIQVGSSQKTSIYDTRSEDIKPFTGKINNIYENEEQPDINSDGVVRSIYTTETFNNDDDDIVSSLDIYTMDSKDIGEPTEKKNTLGIYDSTKETKDIKGGGNSLNIYGK